MKKEENYKFIVTYRAWIEDDFRTQPFKTMLGAKAFFDFVAGDSAIAAAFIHDAENGKIIAKTIKQGENK
jgi:hypothetical protein